VIRETNSVDMDWVLLIEEALKEGISKEEIQEFLHASRDREIRAKVVI
jgi:hypothetical protein